MNDDVFWQLVGMLDWSHEGKDDAVVRPVVKALASRSAQDIIRFQDLLAQKLYSLDGRAWARESGPGVWWNEPGSLSVDGFLYARCVVVANGRRFYEKVLADPKAMPKDMEFESLLYVGPKAWKARTGSDWNTKTSVSFETFSNEAQWRGVP